MLFAHKCKRCGKALYLEGDSLAEAKPLLDHESCYWCDRYRNNEGDEDYDWTKRSTKKVECAWCRYNSRVSSFKEIKV